MACIIGVTKASAYKIDKEKMLFLQKLLMGKFVKLYQKIIFWLIRGRNLLLLRKQKLF